MNLTPPHSSNVSNGEMRDDYRITASPNMFFGRINDGKPTSPLLPTIFPSVMGVPGVPWREKTGTPDRDRITSTAPEEINSCWPST